MRLWILLETCSHIILDREKVNVISPICISFLDKILSHLLKTLSMNENRVENCMKFKFSFEVYELITVLLSAKLLHCFDFNTELRDLLYSVCTCQYYFGSIL